MLVPFNEANISKMIKNPTKVEESLLDVRDNFRKMKWKQLGSGSFGEVWGKPNNKKVVVKLFETTENDAYLAFLQEVQKAQGNPYLPVIHMFGSFISPDNDYDDNRYGCSCRQCKRERAEAARARKAAKKADKPKKLVYCAKYCAVIMEHLDSYTYRKDTNDTYEAINAVVSSYNTIAAMAQFKPQEDQLFQIISRLFDRYEEDLHSGNVMMRGKQLVVTDPVC